MLTQTRLYFRDFCGKQRKLTSSWLEKHHWMRYSVSRDAVYCVYCVLFGTQREDSKERTLGKLSPVSDWTNLSKFVARHTAQTSSHHANEKAGEEFIQIGKGTKDDVLTKMSSHEHDVIENNRHVLREIIKVLLLCARQNIAIRGHTPEKSNFIALLKMKSEKDPILEAHLVAGDERATYLSPKIQNELIELCASQIRTALVTACDSAGCFGFIADEATDCSTREQISLCVIL